jgi:hypothetical protein
VFNFSTFDRLFYCLLAFIISDEKSAFNRVNKSVSHFLLQHPNFSLCLLLFSFLFSFSLCCLGYIISVPLPSNSIILPYAFLNLLFNPCGEFFISVWTFQLQRFYLILFIILVLYLLSHCFHILFL